MNGSKLGAVLVFLVLLLIGITAYQSWRISELEATLRFNQSVTTITLDKVLQEQEAVQEMLRELSQNQPTWIKLSHQVDANRVQNGKVAVIVEAELYERRSDSQLELGYRQAGTGQWLYANLKESDSMVFVAELWLEPDADWEYRVIERQQQAERASNIERLDLRAKFGNGDVILRRYDFSGDKLYIALTQSPLPLLPELKIDGAAVELKYANGSSEEVVLHETRPGYYEATPRLQTELREAVVKVQYGDGEHRTAVLPAPGPSGSESSMPIREPLITR